MSMNMDNILNYVDSSYDAIPKEGLEPFPETICLLAVLTFAVSSPRSGLHIGTKVRYWVINPMKMKKFYWPANVH